jgi:hypothetical protein
MSLQNMEVGINIDLQQFQTRQIQEVVQSDGKNLVAGLETPDLDA